MIYPRGLNKDVLPLARELTRLKKQAAALGLFTNDRELIECTGCDLAEDVTFDGRLITLRLYRARGAHGRFVGHRQEPQW